ncbi:MAG: ABC transporter permease [Acidobacteriaceae bacterium]|nr:ABC transporter permease [Acidobacteriaceae bacterium]
MLARLWSWFDAALHRKQFEREMDSELQGHIQAFTEDLIRRGVPRPEAEKQATREFGAMQLYKDECRDARGLRWADEFVRDLRYAFRLLWKSPAFTLTAVATLALCIGANTAVYSVVDAVLFRPLPYPDPGRLASVILLQRHAGAQYEQAEQDGRMWEAVRDGAKSVDAAVFSAVSGGVNLAVGTTAQYVTQQRVSSGFFRVLGISPLIGREFTQTEDRVGGPPVAVLSYGLWKRVFHADPSIVGEKIVLRGEPYTVTGVMPPKFQSNIPADLWTPLRPSTTGEGGGTNYRVAVRLRPSVSWAEANSEVVRAGQGIIREMHLRADRTASLQLVPLQRGLTEDIREPLLLLWAAVGLVLLIGCVNVAGLLLARSGVRSREIATRLALGSNKASVVRQLLAESLALAVLGGVAGIVLGYFALVGLRALDLSTLGVSETIMLNFRVLGVTAVIALATSLLFGFYPALQTARVDIRSALTQAGTRNASVGHRGWARRSLMVAEVALGVVLLVSAGLLLRTLTHLLGLQPGFDSHHVTTASLSLQDARYSTSEKTMRLFDESLAQIRKVPGIESAGIGLTLPYQRALNSGVKRLDGPHRDSNEQFTNVTYVTPGYFETLRMPLLRGRRFDIADRTNTQAVAVVNEAFVRKYLQDQEAVGSHLGMGKTKCEIVGVISDVQQAAGWGDFGPLDTVPGIYIPAAQVEDKSLQLINTWFSPYWVVRTSIARRNVIEQLQRAVASIDPQLPFAEFKSMDEIRQDSVSFQRVTTTLLGVLAGIATLLAAVGIYGLIAHSVMERTRELGIRMALGATISQAIRTVAMPGVVLAAIGLAVGCVLSLGVSHLLRSLIWGVQPTDPVTFGCVCGALLLIAALASLLPGIRVARIQPAESLRNE